ncbi:hypothetical protein GCM10007384_17410 [Aquimarina muelleri]|uniref:Uncharacterized protein n=1 Tax=Aquimarina muelleri TaxID=279356 RepID=A0A918N335_9FLAO|nr:hypothetical protein GCM10007384_17410 [Aquimarina muelleri]
MINLEAEAQPQLPLRTSASRLIDLTRMQKTHFKRGILLYLQGRKTYVLKNKKKQFCWQGMR